MVDFEADPHFRSWFDQYGDPTDPTMSRKDDLDRFIDRLPPAWIREQEEQVNHGRRNEVIERIAHRANGSYPPVGASGETFDRTKPPRGGDQVLLSFMTNEGYLHVTAPTDRMADEMVAGWTERMGFPPTEVHGFDRRRVPIGWVCDGSDDCIWTERFWVDGPVNAPRRVQIDGSRRNPR